MRSTSPILGAVADPPPATYAVLLGAGALAFALLARAASADPLIPPPDPPPSAHHLWLIAALGVEDRATRQDAIAVFRAEHHDAEQALLWGATYSPDPRIRKECDKLLIPLVYACSRCDGAGGWRDSLYYSPPRWVACPQCHGTGDGRRAENHNVLPPFTKGRFRYVH